MLKLRRCARAVLSSRRLLRPVLGFALLATMITGADVHVADALSIRQTYKMLNKLIAAQLTAEIQPRVFAEQFPDTILYVGDVDATGPVVRWRNVFLADISPPDKRKKTRSGQTGDGPRITTATEAIAVPDVERNRIQLSLVNGSTHEIGQDYTQYFSTHVPEMRAGARGRRSETRSSPRDSIPSWTWDRLARGECVVEARVELHTRLVLPPACLLLALIGAAARTFVTKRRQILGICTDCDRGLPVLHGAGHVDRTCAPANACRWDRDVVAECDPAGVGRVHGRADGAAGRSRHHWRHSGTRCNRSTRRFAGNSASASPALGSDAASSGPQIIDNYVLSGFLFYFGLLLASFVLMTHVYTFFELLSDILKNGIPMRMVAKYLFYLTPKLVYDSTPVSVLVAVLVTFGILTKNNEVTAMKACGVSLYRLAIPVFVRHALR